MKQTIIGALSGLIIGLVLGGLAFAAGAFLAGCKPDPAAAIDLSKTALTGKWQPTEIDDPHWPEP